LCQRGAIALDNHGTKNDSVYFILFEYSILARLWLPEYFLDTSTNQNAPFVTGYLGIFLSYFNVPKCSFWGMFFRLTPLLTYQETPSVGVEDRSGYLRSCNVKLDDQSLGLPDQEEIYY
jgi:hypothetical protein